MPYYWTCSVCGSNLDPGERCNCNREAPRLTAQPGAHDDTTAKSVTDSVSNRRGERKRKENYHAKKRPY